MPTGDGTEYGVGYIDLWNAVSFPNDALKDKQLVQLGFFVKNVSGSGIELGSATLRLTLRA